MAAPPILMKATASLNNKGVRLFENGRLVEAMGCFQLCIDQVFELKIQMFELTHGFDASRSSSSNNNNNNNNGSGNHSSEGGQPVSEGSIESPIWEWSNPALSPSLTLVDNSQSASIFLYSRAVLLREENLPSVTNVEALFDAYSCIAHFNNALAHHVHFLTRQGDRTTCSAWVTNKYYEESYRLFRRSCKFMRNQGELDLLLVAVFNNMGAIFCNELARFRDASECFKASCGTLSDLGETRWQPLEGDEIYLLSMNAFMVPCNSSPAA